MKDFSGKILFLDRSDINTDEIIPAKYLTELTKEALRPYCLEDLALPGFEPRRDVADKAVIHFGYRAFNDETRALFTRRSKELAELIARANRCTVSIVHGVGYRPTINDETMSALVAQSCRQVLGEDKVIYSDTPNMTAEDVGEYLRLAPGTILWLGTGVGENPPALHNPAFCVPSDALPIGVSVHVSTALSYLNA